MVTLVTEQSWSTAAATERFQIDAKTVRKWCVSLRRAPAAGLFDRSCRPHSQPWARTTSQVGLATSTVQATLNAAGGSWRMDAPTTAQPREGTRWARAKTSTTVPTVTRDIRQGFTNLEATRGACMIGVAVGWYCRYSARISTQDNRKPDLSRQPTTAVVLRGASFQGAPPTPTAQRLERWNRCRCAEVQHPFVT